MKLRDLKTNNWIKVNIKLEEDYNSNLNNKECSIEYFENENKYNLYFDDNGYGKCKTIIFLNPIEESLFNEYYTRFAYSLGYVSNTYKNKKILELRFYFFTKCIAVEDNFSISLDRDHILENSKNNQLSDILSVKNGSYFSKLIDNFIIEFNNKKYFLGFMGEYKQSKDNFIEEGFALFSADFMANIKFDPIKKISFIDSIFKSNNPEYLILFELKNSSELEILDTSSQLSQFNNSILNSLFYQNGYIKKWQNYAEKEGQILFDMAKDFGVRTITNSQIESNSTYTLFFDAESSNRIYEFEIGSKYELCSETPEYFNKDFSWENFKELQKQKDSISVKVIKIKGKALLVSSEECLNNVKGKKLIYSLYAEKVQIARRQSANDAIKHGITCMPSFLEILDGNKDYKGKVKRVDDIKIENNNLTSNQLEAIKMAIQTPDIALIQGPPGTGKTTVIKQIIKTINEDYLKSNNVENGELLLTSFQHVAVENLITGVSLNGLPIPKIGKDDSYTEKIDTTKIQELIEKIEEKYPFVKEPIKRDKLFSLYDQYRNSPSTMFELELLNKIINYKGFLSVEIKSEALAMKEKLISVSLYDYSTVMRDINRLRVTKESFADDGVMAIKILLRNKNLRVNDEQKVILENHKNIDQYLDNIVKIKNELLNENCSRHLYIHSHLNTQIENLFEKVKIQLESNEPKEDKIKKVIYKYYRTLKNSKYSMNKFLKEYQVAFGATVQQSAKSKKNIYDTVIVDEAARVSPLDIFIPLVCAKNRIILVGDHRQLPHIYEESIVRELEKESGENKDATNSYNSYIRESFFEFIKGKLTELEKRDGIKRVITLNNQFRMHPLLGEFVSNSFYKDKGEAFNSLLDESHFINPIKSLNNKAAVWVDVPNKKGNESKSSSMSRYREVEANEIVNKLEEWMRLEETKALTFGVISFYSKQVSIINEKLIDRGLYNKSNHLTKSYATIPNRLQVGTVDSFQGKEFDVVLLSMVRSIPQYQCKKIENPNIIYGHLQSENRLCVSMSRQKKVLAVFGDSKMINDNAKHKDCVKGLNNFYNICRDKGVLIE